MSEYLRRLRAETCYPSVRGAVNFVFFCGCALACVAVLAGIISAGRNPLALFGCIFIAVLLVLLSRLTRELMLLAVDTADAAIRCAQGIEESAPPRANLDWPEN